VGTNPTFDDAERTVEPYILDFDEDIYGETIAVEFAHRLRAMTRFASVEDLIAQIGRDVDRTRAVLGAGR
jgi:riboflavin kinase/FMN adenylyltransferase